MLLVVVPFVVLALVLGVLLITKRGAKLDAAPAYDLAFPAGEVIATHKIAGVLGATSQENRIYGTAAGADAITSYFDGALRGAGYEQVSAPEAPGPGDRFLGRYRHGRTTWLLILRPLPQRIDGHTYEIGERGFTSVLVVRLEG